MLAAIGPAEWAELKASYALDPYGDDWERSSMIAANIINTIRSAIPGSQMKPEDWWPDDLFVPGRAPTNARVSALEAALPQLEGLRGLE